MKRFVQIAAVSVLGLGMFAATPSSAQVEFGIGPGGPSVRVGPTDDGRYRRAEMRRIEAERRAAWRDRRDRRDGCRIVTIEEEDEWGRIVTRQSRRC
jgi:hypothetical protein